MPPSGASSPTHASATADRLNAPPAIALRPPREPVRYQAVIWWETFANGDYQTSTISKQVALSGQLLAQGRVELHFHTSPPVIPNAHRLEFLEMMALRLAALYARVVVEAAPTGEFVALRNYADMVQTWETLAQSLRDSTTAEDRLTPTLIDFLSKQLQDPANVLHSLGHDYLYATLVPDFYAKPLGGAASPARTRAFSQFFDKLPLYFTEQLEVLPAEGTETLTLVCRGTLDTQQTNVAAITALIAKAMGQAADAEPAVVPYFHYEATHVLDRATGLPRQVELKVYGRLTERYNKQYSLTISRLS